MDKAVATMCNATKEAADSGTAQQQRITKQKPLFHKRWRFFVLSYLTIVIEKVSVAPLMRCRIRGVQYI